MNKSKFLKKSLAMLLALMLVFAMIPLSASAAEIGKVWVAVNEGGTTAGDPVEVTDVSGTEYNYSIVEPGPSDTVTVSVSLGDDTTGDVRFMDANGIYNKAEADASTQGLFHYDIDAPITEGNYTFGVFASATAQEPTETYTLALSFTEPDADTSVKTITYPGYYQVSNEGNAYTVVAPYNESATPTTGYVSVYLNSSTSEVYVGSTKAIENKDGSWRVPVAAYDTAANFTVKAQNTTQDASYTVTLVRPIPFATFAIEGQRHTSQISRVTPAADAKWQVSPDDNKDSRIEVYIPYGENKTDSNNDFYFTPVFETNYNVEVAAVKNDNTEVELVSGESYNLEDFLPATQWPSTAGSAFKDKKIELKVYYSEDTFEDWYLYFDKCDADPVAAITELRAQNYVAAIDGTTITLSLPASVRNTEDKIYLATTSTITVVNEKTPAVATVDTNNKKITNIDLTKNSYQLRVEAAGTEFDATDEEVKTYTLNIVTVAEQAPQMDTMTLQKADGTGRIDASIDHAKNTITFEVPFGADDRDYFKDEGYHLYWTATNGSIVAAGTLNEDIDDRTPISKSGAAISGSETYLPAGNHANGKFNGQNGMAATETIMVAIGDATEEYTVIFKNALPKTNSTLGTVELAEAGEKVWGTLTDAEKLAATVTAPSNGTNGKITATIPYKEWAAYTNTSSEGAVVVGTLPEGARMYYVSEYPGEVLNEITPLNENDTPATGVLPAIDPTYYNYGKSDATYVGTATTGADSLQILVLSEAVDINITSGSTPVTAVTDNDDYNGLYSIYEYTLTQAAPRTTTEITSFGVYDHDTGYTAQASIANGVITLTVPYYFTDTARDSYKNLYLDFGVQGGETLTAKNTDTSTLADLAFDKKGNPSGTKVTVDTSGTKTMLKISNTFDKIAVTAENGTTRTNDYELVVKVAEPNTGAVLNSVTLAGVTATPDAKKNVNITVPLGTEVTKLAPEFDVSTNAYVTDDNNQIVKEGDTYNFYSARKFTVHAEDDSKATNTYTITVTVSDKFYDVAEDKWYYEEVMEAAGLGWINGSNGYFKPEDSMKRGDFALIIARIMGYDETQYRDSAFPDVDSDLYYSAAIAFCADKGLIGGDGGNFYAERFITREEMAKIICNAAGVDQVTNPEKLYADDDTIAEWAKGYVYGCQTAEIMMGNEEANTFDARSNATRAEAAAVLVRAFANA